MRLNRRSTNQFNRYLGFAPSLTHLRRGAARLLGHGITTPGIMTEATCTLVREDLREVAYGVNHYYPRSAIVEVFKSNDNLRRVYFCGCLSCKRDFGLDTDADVDYRLQNFMPEELLGDYATIYALLIYCNRAGLIRYFRGYRKYLNGTDFLVRENLDFLVDNERVDRLSIIKDILEYQYKFQVRAIHRSLEPTTIDSREVLPIRQDRERKGRGSFGQVYGFEFAHDEYCGKGLEHVARFARKIFDSGSAGIEEWFKSLHVDRLKHGHLMSALTAFWHQDRFSIVFEEADQTLDAYLKSDENSYSSEYLWSQMKGLAAGLAHLHGNGEPRVACHGDLKPANILIVKDVAKIADFGLVDIRAAAQLASSSALSSESADNGSRHPYAAPRGDGMLMDVWSFGAIMSEVATFDLQKSVGLQEFRNSRLEDVQEHAPNLKTLGFHLSRTLKQSVARKIRTLQEEVVHDNPFQEHFFAQEFFDLLRKMLSDRLVECPRSEDVAEALEGIYERAVARVESRPDIWKDVRAGSVPEAPAADNCRLQLLPADEPAGLAHTRCGLLLQDRNRGAALLICCVFYNYRDVDIYIIRERFIRLGQARPSFVPDYADRSTAPVSRTATLRQWDSEKYKFEFNNMRDLLLLQSAMTQQYVFNFQSFDLQSFAILDRRFLKVDRLRPVVEVEGLVVQLWSEMPLQEAQILWKNRAVIELRMHIAIICMARKELFLIKVSSQRIAQPHSKIEQGTVILDNIHYYKVPIHDGLPMVIPEEGGGYSEHKQARLVFNVSRANDEAKDDANAFVEQLKGFQREWEKHKAKERERMAR
ncbi:kinase-like domain-containing protein [Aspergillus varians]